MKMFLGVTEIAGYYSALAPALRRRGHQVHYVMTRPKNPGYEDPDNSGFAAMVTEWCQRLAMIRNRSIVHKIWWKAVTTALLVPVFFWALFRCQFFIFGFGCSILPFGMDLPFLRLFRKKILFICHGSDTRPSYFDCGSTLLPDGKRHDLGKTRKDLYRRIRCVRRMNRWADWIIDNPFSAHLHRRRLLNWFMVGMPCVQPDSVDCEPEGFVRALHAPSSPLVKGSRRIAEAMARVAEDVPGLELVTITGRPRGDVLDAMAKCHFVVDQLYSDTPCAGFATEAAACGRPAIVGGYGWSEEWLKFSGLGEWPSMVCHEKDLETAIRVMARNAEERRRIADAARRLASEWSNDKVAERIERILTGRAPDEWYFEPDGMPVFYSGGGVKEETVREVVRELVAAHGLPSLGLGHHPRLERMAMEFAGREDGPRDHETSESKGVADGR